VGKCLPATSDLIHPTDSALKLVCVDVDRELMGLVLDPVDAAFPGGNDDHHELLGACHVFASDRGDPLSTALIPQGVGLGCRRGDPTTPSRELPQTPSSISTYSSTR